METKIGFKVVRSYKHLISATDVGNITKYAVGVNTVRSDEKGPFAVFKTLEDAKIFVEPRVSLWKWEHFLIFECEYTPSEESKFWYIHSSLHLRTSIGFTIPKGTDYADSVKLIKQVSESPPTFNEAQKQWQL